MSSQDVEGKRSDKTDFAERLGAMNRRWQILQGLISEKVCTPYLKDITWTNEHELQTLCTWCIATLGALLTLRLQYVCLFNNCISEFLLLFLGSLFPFRFSCWKVFWRAGWSMKTEFRHWKHGLAYRRRNSRRNQELRMWPQLRMHWKIVRYTLFITGSITSWAAFIKMSNSKCSLCLSGAGGAG